MPITDPYQSVARGLEGTGAAYIGKGDNFIPSLLAKGFAEEAQLNQQKAAKKAQQQKDAIDRFNTLRQQAKGWELRDGKMLGQMTEDVVKEGARLLSKGYNPFEMEDYVSQMSKLQNIANKSAENEKLFKDLYDKTWQAQKDGTLTEQESTVNFDILEKFGQATPLERNATMLEGIIAPTPKPPKTEPFDPYKDLKDINIGYYSERRLDETGQGYDVKTVKKDELMSQAKDLIKFKPDYYKQGVERGLWTNEKEAADWVYNQKFWQADTSDKDIFRSTEKDNMFGSGYTETQVKEDFQKWKQLVIQGDENAASYLSGVKLPNGATLTRNKLLAKRGEGAAGTQYDYITEYEATTKDGKKIKQTGKFKFAPEEMTDTELYKFYLQSLKDTKRTFGQELSKTTSNTTVDKGMITVTLNGQKGQIPADQWEAFKKKYPNATR